MSEIGDACQIVLICGRMIAAAAQLSLKAAMLAIKVYNTLYLGKWKGSTAFSRFRAIKGDAYEFINICTEDPQKLAAIEKEMEAHSLLFARLPDLCGGDGNTQYVVARSDMHIFAAFLMDHAHGELKDIKAGPVTESDYAGTAVHPESGKYTKEFEDLNESARQAFASRRDALPAPKEEKPLLLPLPGRKPVPAKAEEEKAAEPVKEKKEELTMYFEGEKHPVSWRELLLDPRIRLRDALIRHRGRIELVREDPILEGERWAAFPVHDGEQVVVVPRDDLLSGNTTRKKEYRAVPLEKPPRAMLYTTRQYVVIDVRTGKKGFLPGKEAAELIRLSAFLPQRVEAMENLARNILSNIGPGAVLPALPARHRGR